MAQNRRLFYQAVVQYPLPNQSRSPT
uniref:RNA-dependent RNA polymerase n=1 Tax=Crocidura shantungensis ribovirus 10 TaxID=3139530 RepID=A0AB38ZK27_9VIRU